MKNRLPPKQYLQQCFSCNFETGEVFWKHRENQRNSWNTRWAGKRAGVVSRGRYLITLDGKRFAASRIVWKLYYGCDPVGELDHILGLSAGDAISNLRDVSHRENLKNQALRSSNTSGTLGVSWKPGRRCWFAYITVRGRQKYLGEYQEKFDAVLARLLAERDYGFHKNHGRR